MAEAIGIDIGGTKIAAGIVTEDGTIRERLQCPTPKTDDAEELFRTLVSIVGELPRHDVTVFGIGCGGPMTKGGEEVSPLNIPAWRNFPLKRRVAETFGVPTFVDNDVKALALGEGWKGAASGEEHFLAMVLSTGVGGGIVLEGELLDGATGNAGHIGHLIVDPNGHPCPCGSRGCLEAEVSGPSIARITGRRPEEATPETIERTGRLVGYAIVSAAALLDIRLAVIGGGVARGFGEPFFRAAQATYDERARLRFMEGLRIVPAALGEDGPIIGAAAVGWRGLGKP